MTSREAPGAGVVSLRLDARRFTEDAHSLSGKDHFAFVQARASFHIRASTVRTLAPPLRPRARHEQGPPEHRGARTLFGPSDDPHEDGPIFPIQALEATPLRAMTQFPGGRRLQGEPLED